MTDAPLPLQSPDDAADALLGSARVFVEGLIRIIRTRMDGAARFTARLRRHILADFLLPAEAALRRAVMIIAATLPEPEAKPPTAPPRPAATASPASQQPPKPGPHAPSRPTFRMTDPAPRKTGSLPFAAAAFPARTDAPPRHTSEARTLARFLRRLEALERAAANPVPLAARWRRLQARRAAEVPPPADPIDTFHILEVMAPFPSGLSGLLWQLNEAAIRTLPPLPAPNTS
ncbi:hypothetical protein [Hyphomonas sp.]|uniref:hypothetical protein n=1 Tax=Hyphomonas sp. TaxID=87 RepID=UPI00391CF754